MRLVWVSRTFRLITDVLDKRKTTRLEGRLGGRDVLTLAALFRLMVVE